MIDLKNFKRVLTFFAHPDDETLSAGGTIHRLSELAVPVHVAIPGTGINSRRNKKNKEELDLDLKQLRENCENALSILGVKANNIHLGDFPDNEMDKRPLLELIHWLENLIEKIKPDLILTHHRYCTNIDHQYCHNATIVATRPSIRSHINVLCGEVPSSTGYLRPAQWEPNISIEISKKNLESKIMAMESFINEARPDPHPRSKEVLEALAKVRGSEAGFYYSEAFIVSKCYIER